jgi:hypothetical protein
MTFNIKPWLVLNSIHSSYKSQSSCSDLFVVSIYIKAFCKLQVAKAGLVRGGGSILSPSFIY